MQLVCQDKLTTLKYGKIKRDSLKYLNVLFDGKIGEKTFFGKLCNLNPLQLFNVGTEALRIDQKTSSQIEANKSQASLTKLFAPNTSLIFITRRRK